VGTPPVLDDLRNQKNLPIPGNEAPQESIGAFLKSSSAEGRNPTHFADVADNSEFSIRKLSEERKVGVFSRFAVLGANIDIKWDKTSRPIPPDGVPRISGCHPPNIEQTWMISGRRCAQFCTHHQTLLHLLCLCHDHFVPQLTEQPADPRRMGSGLQGDATLRYFSKSLLHRFRCRRQFLFQNDLACFIQNTVERPAIAQIQTDRQLLLKISFCNACTVLVFFIAGLLSVAP
jgi:hypothetical protein